jgi:hypothetical protein
VWRHFCELTLGGLRQRACIHQNINLIGSVRFDFSLET